MEICDDSKFCFCTESSNYVAVIIDWSLSLFRNMTVHIIIIIIIIISLEVLNAMKAYRGSGPIEPLILNFPTR